jgi:PadR family transcriptional regulator PadR
MAYQTQLDILQGTLDMLILQTLQWGPQHGHGIGQMIRHRSEDLVRLEHGSLYPAFHRLERRGWIAAEWKASATNRRAKYYRLTRVGKKQLVAERGKWDLLVRTIARIMRPA